MEYKDYQMALAMGITIPLEEIFEEEGIDPPSSLE